MPVGVGAVSALGFAPLMWWPLTLLAFAWLQYRATRAPGSGAAFRVTWLFSAGHFTVGLNWIATAFTFQSNMPASFGIAAVLLLSFYLAVFPAMAAALAHRACSHRPARIAFVFLFAALWMAGELVRGMLFTGFAWNPLGMAWLAVPVVPGLASWIGVYGLSGILVITAGAIWLAVEGQRIAALGITLAVALAAVFFRHSVAPTGTGVVVRIVQPNIGQNEKYDAARIERHEQTYVLLSGRPSSVPRVLLWPEAATPRFLDLEPQARQMFARLLGPRDILLTGGESVSLDSAGNPYVYHNSVFALDNGGHVSWRYDKAHLVPFGEYLPMRPLLEAIGLSRLVPGEGDFAGGPGPKSFPLPGGHSVGVQVCYEIIFSGKVIDRLHRPDFLFNPSNDAWFGTWGPPQHFAQARMRAIEEGISVVRATPTGISGVIGPAGEIIQTLPQGSEGVIDIRVPPPREPTAFSKLGLWASGAFALLLAFISTAFGHRKSP